MPKSEIKINKIYSDLVKLNFGKPLPKFADGRIDFTTLKLAPVVTCYVRYKNKILLLKRSNLVNTYKGLWNTVAGYLDDDLLPDQKALIELEEELGIKSDVIFELRQAKPYKLTDNKINRTWIIFPMLVDLKSKPTIILDFEHTEYKWILPSQIKDFDCVPGIEKSLKPFLLI